MITSDTSGYVARRGGSVLTWDTGSRYLKLEDVARTVHLARSLGEPVAMTTEDIDALYDRYQNVYGQR